jgi:hypothetical protein
MNTFVVHKILQAGSRQLLLIRPNDYECSLAVYDEHTGQTLIRMTTCTIAEFERAIAILKEGNNE